MLFILYTGLAYWYVVNVFYEFDGLPEDVLHLPFGELVIIYMYCYNYLFSNMSIRFHFHARATAKNCLPNKGQKNGSFR